MRNLYFLSVITALLFQATAYGQDKSEQVQFYKAEAKLEQMLSGKEPLSYERAIFEIENAFWGNKLDYSVFSSAIDWQAECIAKLAKVGKQNNPKQAKDDLISSADEKQNFINNAFANWAIYTFMCDTSFTKNGDSITMLLPYRYCKKDPLGSVDWSNTEVTHLLSTGEGNCFALASLFKIHADRLHSGAILCTAPEHIYIRHADDHGTYFNVELASHSFPGTGMIETVTYTTDDAVKNNISLRELSDQQSVALAMVYLGKGYENKFGYDNTDFPLQCAETALKYDSQNLNAMLLKAEILERKVMTIPAKERAGNQTYVVYNELIKQLYTLGYREMPLEMKNLLIGGWKADSSVNHSSNPFKELGVKDTKYASLSWGLFDEEHTTLPVERFGQTLLDTRTKKIKGFAPKEELYNSYKFDPVAFALSIDPLAEKYPSISPYVFVADNPIKYVDPNGAEIVVSGAESQSAVNLLRASVSTELSISENGKGALSYVQNNPNVPLSSSAQQLVNAISDKNITVNIFAENTKTTQAGKLYVGGTFSGNTVSTEQRDVTSPFAPEIPIGQTTVTTVSSKQEVNPNVLGAADNTGGLMLHEATESYQGALISQQSGVSAAPATNADVSNPNSVYSRAHNAATPQTVPIYRNFYDASGKALPSAQGASKVEYYVQPTGGTPKVIMTYP